MFFVQGCLHRYRCPHFGCLASSYVSCRTRNISPSIPFIRNSTSDAGHSSLFCILLQLPMWRRLPSRKFASAILLLFVPALSHCLVEGHPTRYHRVVHKNSQPQSSSTTFFSFSVVHCTVFQPSLRSFIGPVQLPSNADGSARYGQV